MNAVAFASGICMHSSDPVVRPIEYVAPQHVRDAVASLGLTEDLKLSPSNRRLAIADFNKNKIWVFEVSIGSVGHSRHISITGVTEILSPGLKYPHGLDFIDDEKILVANREGQMCILELPLGSQGRCELTPLAVIGSDEITTPGSVTITKRGADVCEALICNNYVHRVTRHELDLRTGCSAKSGEVLLKKWLDIPDGICMSKDKRWVAVSNHTTHAVLLYENTPALNKSTDPVGVLLRTNFPHGLRFTPDGRFILVADAGAPYVNIYEKDDLDWRGVRNPVRSIRVLNDKEFLRGRHSRQHGGPKGIDISNGGDVFVATSECQPLAFFDLAEILEQTTNGGVVSSRWARNSAALAVNYELNTRRIIAGVIATLRSGLKAIPGARWVVRKIRAHSRRKLTVAANPV